MYNIYEQMCKTHLYILTKIRDIFFKKLNFTYCTLNFKVYLLAMVMLYCGLIESRVLISPFLFYFFTFFRFTLSMLC